MGTDSNEAGLAWGVVGSARVIAFGASNVAPAGSVVAGLVIVVSYAGFASPLVVLIAFAASMCCASSMAEFARRLPSAGSLYTYSSRGLGRTGGFLTGWMMVFAYVLAGLGFVIATFNVAIRVLFAMGRERVLPETLARLSRRRTPIISIACVAAFALLLGLPLTSSYGGVRTFGYIAGAGGLSVVLVYLAVNVTVIRAFRTEFRGEFGLWRHLLVPATAIVLFLFPLWGILHPRARQLADLLHFTALGWLCLGVIVAVILQARRPSSFETLGRIFMPADGQPEYALESAGDLAAGHRGQEGNGAHDGD